MSGWLSPLRFPLVGNAHFLHTMNRASLANRMSPESVLGFGEPSIC